jgi:hypothetical protein
MSIERAFKPWFQKPTARVRQIRPIHGFHLQPLESRIALSGGMLVPLADVPASPAGNQSAFVQVSSAHDTTAQTRERDAVQRFDADGSDTASPFAMAQPTGGLVGIAPGAASSTTVDAANQGPQGPAPPDQTDSGPQSPQNDSDTGTDESPPGPSEPDPSATPGPTARIAQTNVAEDQFDPGLLGPLAWADFDDQFSGLVDGGAEVEGPLTYTAGLSPSVLSAQPDVADETGVGGYPDFPAAGAWRAFSFAGHDELESLHGIQTVDVRNNSIMAGTMPWRSLLSGLNLPDKTALDEHQRFAELGPLEQSSPLALVATLWTTSSGASVSPGPGDQSAGRSDRHLETAAPLSSWNVYVMRLDEACEPSYRDICQGLTALARATPSSESSSRELAGWPMPIVPMARGEWLGASREALRTDGCSPSDQVIVAPDADLDGPRAAAGELGSASRSGRDPQRGAEPGRAVPGPVPIVTVITGSTLVAGWFWTRRASWPRRRAEQTDSRIV